MSREMQWSYQLFRQIIGVSNSENNELLGYFSDLLHSLRELMSYFLNLHGPSEAVETACSSSLVAIHRDMSVIESGRCTIAIVGGVNTLVSPELHISYSKAGMLSEDGRCKTFGASAQAPVQSM